MFKTAQRCIVKVFTAGTALKQSIITEVNLLNVHNINWIAIE